MKIIIRTIAGLFLMAAAASANASIIVNTGPGLGSNSGGTSLNDGQFLAGQFSLAEQLTITSIEGWIGGSGGAGTLVLYGNNGGVPGIELFSSAFVGGFPDDWYGANGLSWLLDAGTYWAAFEVRVGDTFSGYMEDIAATSTPLANYAFTSNGTYVPSSIERYGFRISGVQNVPSPSVLFLFVIASLATLKFRRKV